MDKSNQPLLFRYYLDSRHELVRETVTDSSLEDIDIVVSHRSKQYATDTTDAKYLMELMDRYVGTLPPEEFYREDPNYGLRGKSMNLSGLKCS